MRLIAGVCTHYVVYNISKKKNTVDKSKIKDKRKVKPKDKKLVMQWEGIPHSGNIRFHVAHVRNFIGFPGIIDWQVISSRDVY